MLPGSARQRSRERARLRLSRLDPGGWVPGDTGEAGLFTEEPEPQPQQPAEPTGGEAPGMTRYAGSRSHRTPPGAGPGWRLALSQQAVVVVGALLAAGVALGLLLLVRARPSVLAAPGPGDPSSASGPSNPVASALGWATPTPSPAGPLVVHVAGLVRRPGVVTLSPGARVIDAIDGAGGAAAGADLGSVNLARLVTDGEQVRVRASGEPAPADPTATTGAPISLNTAGAIELEALPGVGPVLAGRIVDWRTKHGRFSSIEELREVSGIGEKLYAALAPLVRL